ncbi:3-hydroxyacyl-[acyl-carrier-protein] dehydratase FabZ [Bacteroidota bacterium]|nr:3-hydroxyacyl-[acyl-carrier-protein] dehydratase FabZ [Bacteroidota bacterium]
MRFYLLDRVEEIQLNEWAKGIKCWSLSDDVFAEHFPGFPIVPGVLQIESMAQLMGILIEHSYKLSYPDAGKAYPLLSIVQKAKFREPIIPGDQCIVTAKLTSLDIMRATGTAEMHVEGKLKAQSDLSFTIMDGNQIPHNPFIQQRDEYYMALNVKNSIKNR